MGIGQKPDVLLDTSQTAGVAHSSTNTSDNQTNQSDVVVLELNPNPRPDPDEADSFRGEEF